MDTQATLAIAAEVGIGIAGFSSIATAILSRDLRDSANVHWVQVRTLLLTSIAVVMLSYLPMVIGLSPLQEDARWVVASSVYIAWTILVIVIGLRGFAQLLAIRGLTRMLASLTLGLALASVIFNLLNVVSIHKPWPYIAALCCGMLIAFMQFGLLVRGLWRSPQFSVAHSYEDQLAGLQVTLARQPCGHPGAGQNPR